MQILHALRIYYILQAITVRALLLRPRGKYFFHGCVEESDLGSSQRYGQMSSEVEIRISTEQKLGLKPRSIL